MTTYLEAIRTDLLPYPVSSKMVERQCFKHCLDPEGIVVDEKKVSMCVLEILSQMIALGGVSEGGVSSSFKEEPARRRIYTLCSRLGLNPRDYIDIPTVTRIE